MMMDCVIDPVISDWSKYDSPRTQNFAGGRVMVCNLHEHR